MIQANGFLLPLPVAKHLPYGAKHLVMRQTKIRCRSLAIGGIKCRFDAPPSVFRLIRFIELKETTWITAPRQGSSPASAR